MLTDLSFLDKGARFPPACEMKRLEMYRRNKELFESEHAEVYKEQFKRIERVIGNFNNVITYATVLNFQKLMSLKVADLLIGEPPKIAAGDSGSPEQTAIDWIKERSDLDNTCYSTAIDISRYGDGLLNIRKEADYGVIDITQPCMWFPVVSPDNCKLIINHVLAWTCKMMVGGKEQSYLKAQIHYKGSYEHRVCKIDQGIIGDLVENPIITTALNDFAIVQIPNVITSDRVTGFDDYTDIDSIVSDLIIRVSQVDKILDKHADPNMQGPVSALERDPNSGEWKLKAGSYFIVDDDATDASRVSYIVWDAQLEANFKQIERLINLLYTISEMGSAIFGDMTANSGDPPSGTALRRLMVSPLAKVNRIRMRFDRALKKAIDLCSQLGGPGIVNLKNTDISIKWNDGLPADEAETAAIIKLRVTDSATMSKKRALTTYDGMSNDDADAEIETIMEEQRMSSPVELPPVSPDEVT